MTNLETARLILRLPAGRDADVFAEIHQDPEVSRHLVGGPTGIIGPDIAWRNIAMLLGHWQLRGFGSWAVEERRTGNVIRNHTDVDRIISLIQPDNARSIRVATKLGETLAGAREVGGVVHNEYRLTLTR
jgi:RimJ/RimL family protein N-acetyltransferase